MHAMRCDAILQGGGLGCCSVPFTGKYPCDVFKRRCCAVGTHTTARMQMQGLQRAFLRTSLLVLHRPPLTVCQSVSTITLSSSGKINVFKILKRIWM